ncbi:MAG: hypothetical protein LLF78_07410 [Synergistaceae bacterium]|nr:hypothetical protein [Synergistaceae bacterium]
MKNKTETVFVDSINGNVCRLLIGEAAVPVEMPLALLPEGTAEGDCFSMIFEPNAELRAQTLKESKMLLQKLGDNP